MSQLIELFDLGKSKELNIYSNCSNPSIQGISKMYEIDFSEYYHYFCRICKTVPETKFIKKDKIIYKCKCIEKEIEFKEIYDYLIFSLEAKDEIVELKCQKHENEKNIHYCQKCKESFCRKCIEKCIEHKYEVKDLTLDYSSTINKCKYIKSILDKIKKEKYEKEKEMTKKNNDDSKSFLGFDNSIKQKSYKMIPKKEINKNSNDNNIENNKSDEDKMCLIEQDDSNVINISINEKKEELNNFINEYDEAERSNPLNLISIIINDYLNYPNYNHIDTISSIENYIAYFFDESQEKNEINLKYLIKEENILDVKKKRIELFGEIFVNNNIESSCFLYIKDKIMKLSRFIDLSEIFEENIQYPFLVEVKLIESRRKPITDMSFMFNEINTLQSSSDFSKFSTEKVNNMMYMFYNCSSLQELPDISHFNTSKVANMSFMFYNCSSLIHIPDISKWNTKELRDINNMFANCSSLNFIDISNWNIDNLKNMSNLFKNCKFLKMESIPKWEINDDTLSDDAFEGCINLEIKGINVNRNNNNVLSILKKNMDIIYCCFEKIFYIIECLFLLALAFLFLIYISGPYITIYYSFHLDKEKVYADDTIKYFDIKNHTNISFIINRCNYTNSTLIKEIYDDEDKFVNWLLNFTDINNQTTFDSEVKKFKAYNIIIGIIYPIVILFLFFSNYNLEHNLISLNKSIILMLMQFLLNIISIIINIFNFLLLKRLIKKFSYLFRVIRFLFLVKIYDKEFYKIDNSLYVCYENFLNFGVIIIHNFRICRDILNNSKTSKKDYSIIRRKKNNNNNNQNLNEV